jgi:predicted PurR-regulated permease PerM
VTPVPGARLHSPLAAPPSPQSSPQAVPIPAGAPRRREAVHELRTLGAMAIVFAIAAIWVIVPVGVGVLLGAVFAFTAYPLYYRLTRRTRRPVLVALGFTTATTVAVAGTITGVVALVIQKGMRALAMIPPSLAKGGAAEQLMNRVEHPFTSMGMHAGSLAEKLRNGADGALSSLSAGAAEFAAALFDGILTIFFMALTMYFVLRNWRSLEKRTIELLPLNPHHTRRLLRETQRLGRIVVIGNFGTAILQGVVAAIGFAVAQAPEWPLLAALTAVTSLVPVVGTLLIWVPLGLLLLATGHAVGGIIVLAWGTFVIVGFCDYVARPFLVGRGNTMSSWTTLVSLFGGLKLFGFIGIVLGPMIVGLALIVLQMCRRTRRFGRALDL